MHGSFVTAGGSLVVTGGRDTHGQLLDDAWQLDLQAAAGTAEGQGEGQGRSDDFCATWRRLEYSLPAPCCAHQTQVSTEAATCVCATLCVC